VARMSCTTPLKRQKLRMKGGGESLPRCKSISHPVFLPHAFLPRFVLVGSTFGNYQRDRLIWSPSSSELFSHASPLAVIEVLKFWNINYPRNHLSWQAHDNYGLPNPVLELTNIIICMASNHVVVKLLSLCGH
jgi:hypothetical protein